MNIEQITIVLPAYQPDERMITLIQTLIQQGFTHIVVVDDGSGDAYQELFHWIEQCHACTLLRHRENRGKGMAMRSALDYLSRLSTPQQLGCVFADIDGQHHPIDILHCAEALLALPHHLIMGVRTFDQREIPWKSRWGNRLIRLLFTIVSHRQLQDTQTGLRGVPRELFQMLSELPGSRFEFEMNMLLYLPRSIQICEVPIKTIYESRDHHQTHFNALLDSLRILQVFARYLLRLN